MNIEIEKEYLIQSYGRKRLRGLSRNQQEILTNLYEKFGIHTYENENKEKCNLVDPLRFFDTKFDNVVVEIGFGMGEHMIQNAKQNPNCGMIGCEPLENGVINVLLDINEKNIHNVRVYKHDARILLRTFNAESVSRFYVLFPDPWHKTRHHKRRLLSVDFMSLMKEKLRIGGDVVIATDCSEYIKEILENISKLDGVKVLDSSLARPELFIPTKYEKKAIEKGKQPFYIKFDKTS